MQTALKRKHMPSNLQITRGNCFVNHNQFTVILGILRSCGLLKRTVIGLERKWRKYHIPYPCPTSSTLCVHTVEYSYWMENSFVFLVCTKRLVCGNIITKVIICLITSNFQLFLGFRFSCLPEYILGVMFKKLILAQMVISYSHCAC